MKHKAATTVAQYLASLPKERRDVIAAVRAMIRRHLPKGYTEGMNLGMIGYAVPLRRYPDTYNGQPLCFAGLAANKNGYSLYLMSAYQNASHAKTLKDAFKKAGKKLDMGKSCIRFRSADDLPLDAIGKLIAATPVEAFIAQYEASRRR